MLKGEDLPRTNIHNLMTSLTHLVTQAYKNETVSLYHPDGRVQKTGPVKLVTA